MSGSLARRVFASVFEHPADVLLTVTYVVVLLCVVDAGVHIPVVPRALQICIASAAMLFGGFLFTCSCYALPSAGMVLPGSDPRRKPLTSSHHVFGLCRHPQFAGLILLCFSICLISRSADRQFYTLLLILVLDKKADLEERAIVQDHPEYARYLLQTPKFIPNLSSLGGLLSRGGALADHAPHALARDDGDDGDDDDDASSSLLRSSVKHEVGELAPAEREHLERLAAEGRGNGARSSRRLMDAHSRSRAVSG